MNKWEKTNKSDTIFTAAPFYPKLFFHSSPSNSYLKLGLGVCFVLLADLVSVQFNRKESSFDKMRIKNINLNGSLPIPNYSKQ